MCINIYNNSTHHFKADRQVNSSVLLHLNTHWWCLWIFFYIVTLMTLFCKNQPVIHLLCRRQLFVFAFYITVIFLFLLVYKIWFPFINKQDSISPMIFFLSVYQSQSYWILIKIIFAKTFMSSLILIFAKTQNINQIHAYTHREQNKSYSSVLNYYLFLIWWTLTRRSCV